MVRRRAGDGDRFDSPIAPDVVDVDAPRDYDLDVAITGDAMLERAALAGHDVKLVIVKDDRHAKRLGLNIRMTP